MNMVFTLAAFLGPFVFLLAAGILIRPVWRGLFVPRAVRAGRPVCGGCGHQVADPIPERCPECGQPYQSAGVLSRSLAARTRETTLAVLVSWTILGLAMVAFVWPITAAISQAITGDLSRRSGNTTLQPGRPWDFERDPAVDYQLYDLDLTYDLVLSGQWYGPNPTAKLRAGEFSLTLSPDNGPRGTLRWSVNDGEWSLQTAEGTSEGEGVDRDVVLQLYESAGLDTNDHRVAHEIDQLEAVVPLLNSTPIDVLENIGFGNLDTLLAPDRAEPESFDTMPVIIEAEPWRGGRSTRSGGSGSVNMTSEFRLDNVANAPVLQVTTNADETPGRRYQLTSTTFEFEATVGWPVVVKIDTETGSWSMTAGSDQVTQTGETVDSDLWESAWRELGRDPNGPDAAAVRALQSIYEAVPSMVASWRAPVQNASFGYDPDRNAETGGFTVQGGGSSSGPALGPAMGYVPPAFIAAMVALGVLAIVYLVGVVFIVRRRRKLLAPPA